MYSDMSYPASVSTFRLDKYEVTVGRFRAFVAAQTGTRVNPPLAGAGGRTLNGLDGQGGWDASWDQYLPVDASSLGTMLKCDATFQTWTDAPAGNEDRPANCMTWYEAMAFCIWDGGFLPTEAQWNYAATGGDEQRGYPWSSPPAFLGIDATRASYYVDSVTQCIGDGVAGCTLADLIPVGSKPAGDGRWGQSDLSGNVNEWTLDQYAAPYSITPCDDCANLTTGAGPSSRGGDYGNDGTHVRTGWRVTGFSRASRSANLGFRCAR
jgi:formylglycine-generating enzyme required for sulfatase activity